MTLEHLELRLKEVQKSRTQVLGDLKIIEGQEIEIRYWMKRLAPAILDEETQVPIHPAPKQFIGDQAR